MYYHLDTAVFPISNNLIAIYENALTKESLKKVYDLGCEIIKISYQDAKNFACNSIALGNHIVMNKNVVDLA